jgi:hypothetical protein
MNKLSPVRFGNCVEMDSSLRLSQAWELMVGNSNTRWSSGPPCIPPTALTKEPPIPWCGIIWPDGTPVSFTEAAAIRRYLSGVSDFLLLDTFLPAGDAALTHDVTLNLTDGVVGYYTTFSTVVNNNTTEEGRKQEEEEDEGEGVMVETSLWLGDETHAATIFVGDCVGESSSSSSSNGGSGWELRLTHSGLEVLRVPASGGGGGGAAKKVVGTIAASTLPSGVPVGAWNLLRFTIHSVNSSMLQGRAAAAATVESEAEAVEGAAAAGVRETLSVFLNPTAHATGRRTA